jgi:hypothetical protein
MKRILLLLSLLTVALAMTKDPGMKYFRAQFPLVKLNPNDTLHFAPDPFIRGTYDAAKAKFFYDILLCRDSFQSYNAYSSEHFFRPMMRGRMNGCEFFVGEYGDTNELSIYYGKDVLLFIHDKKTGFRKPFILAFVHAGEGPWFETESWFVDLNHDKKIDILTREKSYAVWDFTTKEGASNYEYRDELSAHTVVDTGVVKIPLINPDSLKRIYGKTTY